MACSALQTVCVDRQSGAWKGYMTCVITLACEADHTSTAAPVQTTRCGQLQKPLAAPTSAGPRVRARIPLPGRCRNLLRAGVGREMHSRSATQVHTAFHFVTVLALALAGGPAKMLASSPANGA